MKKIEYRDARANNAIQTNGLKVSQVGNAANQHYKN